MNIPIALTLFRIVLIPVFVVVFYLPIEGRYFLSALIFVVACATDYLDGYLARKWDQTTALGAFLDPVADKLIVAIALALLIERYTDIVFTLPAVVIIGREIVVSALREWMAELGKRASVAVSFVGKVKTFAQMGAITGLLLSNPENLYWLHGLSLATLYVAAALTLWSMLAYLRAAWPELRLDK